MVDIWLGYGIPVYLSFIGVLVYLEKVGEPCFTQSTSNLIREQIVFNFERSAVS